MHTTMQYYRAYPNGIVKELFDMLTEKEDPIYPL